MKKPRQIHIHWRDSFALQDGWSTADYKEVIDPICETTGFYFGSNKTHHIVALNISHKKGDGSYDSNSTILIPIDCVVKKRFLK